MFRISYTLPVAGDVVKYKHFTNAHFFDVMRYVASNIDDDIIECFDVIIQELTNTSPSNMINVDKFCLLADIRSMFLGDQMELSTNKGASIKIKLSTMLNTLSKSLSALTFKTVVKCGDVHVTLSLPGSMHITNDDQLITQTIQRVCHNGQEYDFVEFSSHEQETFINSLPVEIMLQIHEYLKLNSKKLPLIVDDPTIGVQGVDITPYDGSMLQILKTLYTEDMMNFYEMQFSLITKMNVSYDHYMSMTPSESRIYVNLYNKDIKRQEEAANKQSHPQQ